MKREYTYNILMNNSREVFRKLCNKIEKYYPMARKDDLAIDVDGTAIQIYNVDGGKIVVFDDYELEMIYIESDIELPKKITSI